MRRRNLLLVIAAFALSLTALVATQRPSSAQEAEATIGEPAPDFTLTDESGNSHTLSQYRGQIVVLEWTSPQCPFVQRHYVDGNMQQTASSLAEQGVVWLAVDSSHFNTAEDSRQWKAEMGFAYPTLIDTEGNVGRLYGARTTPHMYVIDAAGVLRYQGAIDDDRRGRIESPTSYVDQAVTALMAGEAPPVASTDPYGCTVKYE